MTLELFKNETSIGSWNISDTTDVAVSYSKKQNVFKLTLNQYGKLSENSLFTEIFKKALQGNKLHINSTFINEFNFDGVDIRLVLNNAVLEFARREEI